jgi:acyl-CoA synthetase (AMP-forming)/AMP-acid ligase II
MSPREVFALRDYLGPQLKGRTISDARHVVSLTDILSQSSLDARPGELSGRSVLISVTGQLMAGLAMIEIDGIARRMLLCPPDLNPDYLSALIEDAEIDTVITDQPERWTGSGIVRVVTTGLPMKATVPVQTERATEWLMLTSGTSGIPKIVGHTLEGLCSAIVADGPARGTPQVWATFYDIRRYGGLQIFLRAIIGGGSMVLSQSGEALADHVARLDSRGVTHISGTPSHWRKLLMSGSAAAFAPRYVRLSGEISDQAVLDGLAQAFPNASIGHAYASTEAGVGFAVNDGREGFPASLIGPNRNGVEMKVVDGRRGGIINIGGLKVHPEEIEAVINRHADVRMSRAKSRRSPITGSIVVADVILTAGNADRAKEIREEILANCRASLASHKVPAVIRFVEALDVTPAGKLARSDA